MNENGKAIMFESEGLPKIAYHERFAEYEPWCGTIKSGDIITIVVKFGDPKDAFKQSKMTLHKNWVKSKASMEMYCNN